MTRTDLSGGVSPPSVRTMNLSQVLTDTARRHCDQTGLIRGDRRWTFAELDDRATAFARALVDRFGVQKGDRLLVQSTNCHQMFEAMLGCWRAGAVWVPANFRLSPAEVVALAEDAQARGQWPG